MPIRDRHDAQDGERQLDDALNIERRLNDYFVAAADDRPAVLRSLFAEVLDFDPAAGQVALTRARQRSGVTLPDAADRIASLDGVQVCAIDLSQTNANTERVRKNDVLAAFDDIRQDLGDDLLLLVRNRDGDQLHWIHPRLQSGPTPTLRRIVVERDAKQRTVVQQLANIWWEYRASGDIRAALDRVFDVEPVTKRFFDQYKRIFDAAEAMISGFNDDEAEPRRQFVQTLFNRLMFVYFLSRKRWLSLNGQTDYLNAIWRAYKHKQHPTHANFYDDVLHRVFFLGLNSPDSRDLRRGVDFIIGDVPFLNGGLFEQTDLDQRDGIIVPDDAIRPLLTDLFDRFNFTVRESTPFDIEVAVDPEMLGKVFERLIIDRRASGAYYTPRPVVAFMCREALKGYLETHTQLDPETIAAFVDRPQTDDTSLGLSVVEAQSLANALAKVTVVDPACGSGAYLVGMMQELVELQTALFNVGVDDQSLHDLKLHIIERNLYGADIDPFAVNIAMLRLWLSLAIEYEGKKPQPLPNLDFKIVQGDSLLGPDPSQISLDSHAIRESNLAQYKSQYMRARAAEEKSYLRKQITAAEASIAESFTDTQSDSDAIDWRIAFAEVIGNGGFDIAIANPPYVRQEQIGRAKSLLLKQYKDVATGRSDLYCYFYARGCQLLRREGGLLAYITSNSWLRAEYGKKLRQYFAEHHTPLRWLDLGKDVFDTSIVDSGILLLQNGGGGQGKPFPAVDMDDLPGVAFPPSDDHWREARPDGDATWSILSSLEWSVIDKMRAHGTPLKEWDIKTNIGILTGYNKAFIIDTATRDALIAADPKSAEIIKPILRGRDIQRWRAQWAGLWLIDTHNGYGDVAAVDVEQYPAIKERLDSFLPQIINRQDQGHTYYNLRSCAYYEEFAKEKLLWMDMSPEGRFAYSENMLFCNDKAYVLTGASLKFLCAVLNSKLVTWFVQPFALTTGMGVLQWKKFSVQAIPVPKVETADQAVFIALVDRILDAKDRDPDADTSALERQIDRLVYDLYGLTHDEIAAVEARLS